MTETNGNSIQRQGIFYVIVGLSSAAIELVLFQLFVSLTPLPLEAANITAVVLATIYNFLLNRSVTFKSTSNPLRSLVLYSILFLFNITFSTLTIRALVSIGWHSAIAKVFTQGCIVLWNFVLYRKVIFV